MPKLLSFTHMGNPILKQIAEPVNLNNIADYHELIHDMIFTIDHQNKRLGLSAPQVNVSKRIFIFRLPEKIHPRYGNESVEPIDLHALINPEITPLSTEEILGWEACISIPGLVGKVPRYKKISYSFYDEQGTQHTRIAEGFHARVVQHEMDHLNGILFPERMTDLTTFGFENEIIKPTT
jgi:peptide deformylase